MSIKNWIQKALPESAKGKLREKLGIGKDKKIPSAKLKSAEKKGGKIAREAHLAENLKKLKK